MSTIQFFTFGTKYKRVSRPPADLYVDCAKLPNPPHFALTGQSRKVREWMRREISRGLARQYYDKVAARILRESQAADFTEQSLTVGFHCFGGRHRSVFVSESIAEKLQLVGIKVGLEHLDLGRQRVYLQLAGRLT